MKTTKAQQRAVEATEENLARETGVRMQMEMVVREDVIIPFGPNGQTVGEILDAHLMDLSNHGGEPRSFTFTFDTESWEQAKPMYQERYREKHGIFER